MRTINLYALIIGVVCSSLTITNAQENDLGDEQINVIKAFEPTLRDSRKISDIPAGDTGTTAVPSLSYDIQPIGMVPNFNVSPIKAFKLKENTIKKLYKGFVKIGYGTRNSPYAEVYYNNKRSKKNDFGVHLKHYSAGGKVKDRGKTNNSENLANVFYNRYLDDAELSADISFARDVVRFYGFDPDVTDFTKKQTKHSFNDISVSIGLKSNHSKESKLSYHGLLAFNIFEDNRDAKENFVNLQVGAAKNFDIHRFGLNADMHFGKTEFLGDSDSRSVLRFDPYYKIKRDLLDFHAGLNFTIAETDKSKAYVYPDVRILFNIIRDKLVLRAHGKGYLTHNNLKYVSKENPFLTDSLVLKNSSTPLELRGTLSATIEKNIQVSATAAISTVKDALFYLNTLETTDFPQTFSTVYDDATVLNLGGEIDINTSKKLGGGAALNIYSYNTDNLDKPLHKPTLEISAFAKYKLQDKIEVRTEWFLRNNIYAYDYTNMKPEKMDGFIDTNLALQYNYSKILSVFLELNNLGASRYEYWYNYPGYRFHALAGLSYSF